MTGWLADTVAVTFYYFYDVTDDVVPGSAIVDDSAGVTADSAC